MNFRLPYAGFYEEILPGVPLDELEDHFREGFANSEASGVTSPLLPFAVDFLRCLQAKNKRTYEQELAARTKDVKNASPEWWDIAAEVKSEFGAESVR